MASVHRSALGRYTVLILLFACPLVKSTTTFSEDDPKSCTLGADDDVYGVGIRYSLYLQWAAVLLATWVAPNEARSARSVTNITTIAVVANTLKNPIKSGSVVVLEWWIVVLSTFALQLGNIPFSRRRIAASASSLGSMLILWSVILFVNCWVWFGSPNMGRREGCDVKIWLFFRTFSIYHPRTQLAFRILSALGAAAGLITLLCGFAALGWNVAVAFAKRSENGEEADEQPQSLRAAVLSTVSIAIMGGVAITETEMTIKANGIEFGERLSSSGQLLPFVLGILTLVATAGIGLRNLLTAHPLLPVQIPMFKRNVTIKPLS
jgi:hypothetical protein